MTILEDGLNKKTTENLTHVAQEEHVDVRTVIKAISKGSAVVVQRANSKAVGIGYPFRTKIQGNWGKQSEFCIDPSEPQKKHPINEGGCSMCGKHCALSISQQLFNKKL